MSADDLEQGYRRAYRDFYRWGSILRGASAHGELRAGLRHAAYAGGWKKFEPEVPSSRRSAPLARIS